jgi:hypothetical protein
MRELKQEKRAIEAQLKSIRAVSSQPRYPTELAPPSAKLQPSTTQTRIQNVAQFNPPHSNLGEPDSHTSGSRASGSGTSGSPKLSLPSINSDSSSSPPLSSEQSRSAANAARPRVQTYPFPDHRPAPSELAATVERLKQQSEFYVRQFHQLQSHTLQTPREILNQAFQALEAHVQQINQLSAIQESAILELKAMAAKVEQDWAVLEQSPYYNANAIATDIDRPPICEYEEPAVPHIEKNADGMYVVTARSIDLFKAEREANMTAQALRHWAEREKPPGQAAGGSLWAWLTDLVSSEPEPQSTHASRSPQSNSSSSPSPAQYRSSSRRARSRRATLRRSRSKRDFGLREGVALLVGAFLLRLTLNLIAAAFPMFWTPAVALLVTPAAIMVYRTGRTSQSGLSWIYRILLIMLGLLLGGRL